MKVANIRNFNSAKLEENNWDIIRNSENNSLPQINCFTQVSLKRSKCLNDFIHLAPPGRQNMTLGQFSEGCCAESKPSATHV